MAEATIRDVARRAQVSVASVSRALNGLDNVSEKTRAKVAAAVHDLGYVPHAGARSLSLARTSAIGVLLPDVHGEFFSEIVRGMDVEANRRGYLLLLSNMHAGSAQAVAALRAMRGRVDGLVVMAPHLDRASISRALPPASRAVLINAPGDVDSHSNIRIDNHAGVLAIVEHLKATGRQRIVYVGGPAHNLDAQERAAAFDAASSGDERILAAGDFSVESGEAAVRKLIGAGGRFDAVFAANDMMAIGAMQALRAAGLRFPEDVAVAGFDDVPLARHLDLTTVRVRIAELGARALSQLIGMLENGGGEPRSELHSPELVIRRSTAPGT
jgi:LacI family transcriptional regulator